MKKYLILLFILTFSTHVYSLDQSTLDQLNQQGMQVIMGELTGAGSKANMQNLVGFVINNGILLKENCSKIVVKDSNIVNITVDQRTIESNEIDGLILKNMR